MFQTLNNSKGLVHVAVLSSLGIDFPLYDAKIEMINNTVEMQAKAKEITQRIEITERSALMGENYEPLTKEVALKRIKQIETKKSEFVAKLMIKAEIGKYPKEKMGLVCEIAKFKAIDAINDENGVEEGDIIIAYNKYQLGETPEFRDIIEEE